MGHIKRHPIFKWTTTKTWPLWGISLTFHLSSLTSPDLSQQPCIVPGVSDHPFLGGESPAEEQPAFPLVEAQITKSFTFIVYFVSVLRGVAGLSIKILFKPCSLHMAVLTEGGKWPLVKWSFFLLLWRLPTSGFIFKLSVTFCVGQFILRCGPRTFSLQVSLVELG